MSVRHLQDSKRPGQRQPKSCSYLTNFPWRRQQAKQASAAPLPVTG